MYYARHEQFLFFFWSHIFVGVKKDMFFFISIGLQFFFQSFEKFSDFVCVCGLCEHFFIDNYFVYIGYSYMAYEANDRNKYIFIYYYVTQPW